MIVESRFEELLFVLLFCGYWSVLLANLVAGVICLVAGPRSWSQDFCLACLWLTGFFLAAVVGVLTEVTIRWHDSTDFYKAGYFFGWIAIFCIPVVLEFLALLAIKRWRLRARPPR
jgi:hypothetical protein